MTREYVARRREWGRATWCVVTGATGFLGRHHTDRESEQTMLAKLVKGDHRETVPSSHLTQRD